jgi:hypothetical protein
MGEILRLWTKLFACVLLVYTTCPAAPVVGSQPQVIHFSLESKVPTANALISGVPVSLYLSLSGYKSIALRTEALGRVPVTLTGDSQTYRDGTGAPHTGRVFNIGQLEVDTFGALGLEGVELPPDDTAHASLGGYLGLGLLMHYFLVFDYARKSLTFYPPGTAPTTVGADCGVQSPFRIELRGGIVQTGIETENGKLTFMLDTASSENVLRPSAIGLPTDSNQTSFAFSQFRIAGRQLGRTRFVLHEFTAPDVDGVLGTDFFRSAIICLDVGAQSGWLNPSADH